MCKMSNKRTYSDNWRSSRNYNTDEKTQQEEQHHVKRGDKSREKDSQHYEDDHDDDDDDLLPGPAFYVSGAPDFSLPEPDTAEEYLRRVRWEAAQQPRVLVATDINPRHFDQLQTKGYTPTVDHIPRSSQKVLPSPEWQAEFTLQFADLRQSCLYYTEEYETEILPTKTRKRTAKAAEVIDTPTQQTAHTQTAESESEKVVYPGPRDFSGWLAYCLGADHQINTCIQKYTQTYNPHTTEQMVGEQVTPAPQPQSTPPALAADPTLHVLAAFDQVTVRGIIAQMISHLYTATQRIQNIIQQQQGQQQGQEPQQTQQDSVTHADRHADTDTDTDTEVARERPLAENTDDPDKTQDAEVHPTLPPPFPPSAAVPAEPMPPVLLYLSVPSQSASLWLYCLLARLEKPVPVDLAVQLRQLYRTCGIVRKHMGDWLDAQPSAVTDEPTSPRPVASSAVATSVAMNPAHPSLLTPLVWSRVMCCNMLMTIVDKIFGQRVEMQ